MAIAQAQYVDLLVKQLYGVAKTDTSTIKSPSNERIYFIRKRTGKRIR